MSQAPPSGQGPPAGEFPGLPPYVVRFGPKANCTINICPVQYSVYGYRPSLIANVLYIALFAVAGLVHIYLGFRWKSRFFAIACVIGCISAILGYLGRVLLYRNPFDFAGFMLQITCITTTPVYFCAAIYITFAQVINTFAPQLSRFNPSYFYWVFLPCDIVSLALQAAGGAMSVSAKGASQLGVNLALAGLAFQVVTIVIFCSFMGDFTIRYFRSEINATERGWRVYTFFSCLYGAVILITVRCVFRLVELREGYGGSLVKDEALFIGLEGTLVFAATCALTLGHPGLIFNADGKTKRLSDTEYPLNDHPSIKSQAQSC